MFVGLVPFGASCTHQPPAIIPIDEFQQKAASQILQMRSSLEPASSDRKLDPFVYFSNCKESPRPYVIAVQAGAAQTPESLASTVGESLDALRRTFYARYSPFVDLKDLTNTPIPVVVFRAQSQYELWHKLSAREADSKSTNVYYSHLQPTGAVGTLYLWIVDPQESLSDTNTAPFMAIEDALWREGVRQILDANSPGFDTSESNMPWLTEGICEYVAGHSKLFDKTEPDGWKHFFGLPRIEPRSHILRAHYFSLDSFDTNLSASFQQPLLARIDTTRAHFTSADDHSKNTKTDVRSVGWALCHMLQHSGEARRRERFHTLFQRMLAQSATSVECEQLLEISSPVLKQQLETELQNYIALTIRRDCNDVSNMRDNVYKKYLAEFEQQREVKLRR